MNVCEAHSWCCFSLLLIHAQGSVWLLRRNLIKEKEGVWRRRIYRKYASCKWLKNAGLEFTRADVVVSISRGPPGQWFPKTEHWASAIFVGTSGIPPKIIYRSVKSYNCTCRNSLFRNILYCNFSVSQNECINWIYHFSWTCHCGPAWPVFFLNTILTFSSCLTYLYIIFFFFFH